MNELRKNYPYPKFWKYAEKHHLYSQLPDYTMFVWIFLGYFGKHGYKCGIELTSDQIKLHKMFEECERFGEI